MSVRVSSLVKLFALSLVILFTGVSTLSALDYTYEAFSDRDLDGISDDLDLCPDDAEKIAPGQCGCGVVDIDNDGDTIADCLDLCPDDDKKVLAGVCGCGIVDSDSDQDGILDCLACTSVDLSSTRTRMDRILKKQRTVFRKLLRLFRQVAGKGRGGKLAQKVNGIYQSNLDIISEIPVEISSCPENNLCAHTSIEPDALNYKANARAIDLFSKIVVQKIGGIDRAGAAVVAKSKSLRGQARKSYKRSLKAAGTLPASKSAC